MRYVALLALLPLLALLAIAPAHATEPLPPWQATFSLTGEPVVGAVVTLNAAIVLNAAFDGDLSVRVPPGVDVLDGPQHATGQAGETMHLSWQLRPTRVGPWDAGVEGAPANACCLRGWSTHDEGAWATAGQADPWPQPTITFDLSTQLIDDETVRFTHTATTTGWAAAGTLHVGIMGPDAREGYGNASASVSHEVPLADGGGTVITRHARIEWPFAYGPGVVASTCQNVEFERNGGARPIDQWSCETQERGVPLPAVVPLAPAVLLAAWLRRGPMSRP